MVTSARVGRGLVVAPWCLAVAWLVIAPLYATGVEQLPEPAVALVVSTTIALAVAAIGAPVDRRPSRPPGGPAGREGTSPKIAPSVPTASRAAVPVQPRRERRPPAPPIDLDAYDPAVVGETQCPHCGSFDVRHHAETDRCDVCATTWPVGAPPSAVVVRSWLHR